MDQSGLTDRQLVERVLSGEVSAYGMLASRWAPSVMAVCHCRTGRADAAEDLTQETLLRGLRALPSLSDRDRFAAWLRGIAVRTCLDWLKAPARKEATASSLPRKTTNRLQGAQLPDNRVAHREQLQRLMSEVEKLEFPYRQVLMHFYYNDSSYKQIAEELGVSVATINARLTKARQILRSRLAVEANDEL